MKVCVSAPAEHCWPRHEPRASYCATCGNPLVTIEDDGELARWIRVVEARHACAEEATGLRRLAQRLAGEKGAPAMTNSIDGIEIDSDEGGFTLRLEGDFTGEADRYLTDDKATGITFRLPGDQAEELLRQVLRHVFPWAAEGERHRDDYDRATPEERARVLGRPLEPADEPGFDAEAYREGIDLKRKIERERGDGLAGFDGVGLDESDR